MKTKTSFNTPPLETKNLCGKTRPVNEPYEIWKSFTGNWEWRVLKKWQSPAKEKDNAYARWFCAVKSPHTSPGYDMGDTYVKDIKTLAYQVKATTIEKW